MTAAPGPSLTTRKTLPPYGLTVFSGGSGPERFRRAIALAQSAECAGFGAIWSGELYNRSATVPMAVLAASTSTALIGSDIAYGVGRTPLIWAAEARDLDELSGGRLVLGLGNGTPKMMTDWHGVDGAAPAARMSELIEVLRKLWLLHEGPVHHDGRFYRVHLQPTAATAPPVQNRLPIWTAGVNPVMIRMAGRTADGLIGHPMFTARYVAELVRPELAAGAERGERSVEDVALMGMLMCAVDDDEQVARDQLAFAIAQYAASRVYDRLFALHGWVAVQDRIRAAVRSGDRAQIVSEVPDEVIDAVGVAARPDELADRVAAHASSYDHLNICAPPWGLAAEHLEHATATLVQVMQPLLLPVVHAPRPILSLSSSEM